MALISDLLPSRVTTNLSKSSLNIFREKEPIIYEGDLMDEEGVLDFLTSLEAMDLPDRIEEVNGKILSKIIEDTDYVAVLFCEYKSKSNLI